MVPPKQGGPTRKEIYTVNGWRMPSSGTGAKQMQLAWSSSSRRRRESVHFWLRVLGET